MCAKPNDFVQLEHDVLTFWQQNSVFGKLQQKNKEKPPFRFLDGPITANNSMGIHHAWGRTLKDSILRYKAMTGHSCLYRNGFDTQGLWVEVEVEKELGFKDKKDVEAYGLDKFTRKCVERIEKYSGIITEQSKRLGQWMDWENSYYTHTDENITSIWHFLKKCHENGWIEKANRPMPWCPRCGTSLSEHEMTGSHKDLTHTAVFATVPVAGEEFDMLVWTTTPWTLSANMALAVNPELEYARVRVAGRSRPVVLAKAAIKQLPEEREVLDIFKGSALVGLEYETFFPKLTTQQGLQHTVIPWEDVQAGEGSGVVHIAPGCGKEDFELGKLHNLPEICPVDENGIFFDEYDFLAGESASGSAQTIFDALEKSGKLFSTHAHTHSYPVCWRCKTEVLFRLVQEWYIRTDEVRPQLLAAAKTVQWEPEYIGKRMEDWLLNMGDWNISRKRFYGLPLPFYLCEECGELTVIGSKEELRTLGGSAVDDLPELHRPWVDEVKITCPNCAHPVTRVPEVGDVWLDAGITPFSTLGYFSDRPKWEQNFPAEWVIEMREQVRLWFYSQLFMSVTLIGKAPYERVLGHGSVVQEDGTKFSKTGFMINFDDAAEELGADAIRYLYAGANATSDMRFGYKLCEEARRKMLGLWNIHSFFKTYAELDRPNISNEPPTGLMDNWLVSRVNHFSAKARAGYEQYDTATVVKEFEICIDDVSNWYVRQSRRRFWKKEMDADKRSAYNALFYAIKTLTQTMAPITPFTCEQIWQDTVLAYGKGEMSVHLSDFPQAGISDDALLDTVGRVRQVIASALNLRNTAGIKVKQPLPTLYVSAQSQPDCVPFAENIRAELNTKEIMYLPDFKELQDASLTLDFKTAGSVLKQNLPLVKEKLSGLAKEQMQIFVQAYENGEDIALLEGELLPRSLFTLSLTSKPNILQASEGIPVALNTEISEELRREGMYREILRYCQVLRKDAGLNVSDKVLLSFASSNKDILAVITEYRQALQQETLSQVVDSLDAPAGSVTVNFENDSLMISVQKDTKEMNT